MRSVIEPGDLLLWRRGRQLKQSDLAALLGVHRRTVGNWETGRTPVPLTLQISLEKLACTLAPKAAAPAPAWLTVVTARLRPDLQLYTPSHRPGQYLRGDEHPSSLHRRGLLTLEHPITDQHGREVGADLAMWPWSVLEAPEYAAALIQRPLRDAAEKAARERRELAGLARAKLARINRYGRDTGEPL